MNNLEHKEGNNCLNKDKPTNLEMNKLAEEVTLEVFHVGTKNTNYQILIMLPTNIETIMKETRLTKVPANNHVNELEKVGLVKREKGTGRVEPTKMTKLFTHVIQDIQKQVKSNVLKMIMLTENPETIFGL